MDNKKIGKLGEKIAEKFLKKKGFKILERNWGSKWGEVDLICKDKDTFVFVEVKTKIGESFGSPEEMINPRKLHQVRKVSYGYELAINASKRIDVVAIVLDSRLKPLRIEHYEAVY